MTLYIDDFIYNVAIYADDTTLYSKCDHYWNWLLNLNLIYKILWTGAESGLLISVMEKLN